MRSLCAETVSLLHETLDGKARELLQAAEIPEMGDDGLIILFIQEPLESQLDLRLHGHMAAELLRIPPLEKDVICIIIFIRQRSDVAFGYCLDRLCDLVDRIGVHFPAEPDLRFHLVAIRNRHISHVVSHPHHPHMAALDHADSCAHPGCDLLLYRFIFPVSDDNFTFNIHPGKNMPELTAAVGGLVLIHEIHVDRIVRDLPVELGVQVEQRLAILLQPEDPGFCRGKCVHPGDHAGACLIHICLVESLPDQFIGDQRRLQDNLIGQPAGLVKLLHDNAGVLRHMCEAFVPIEILGSCAEPEFVLFPL